MKPRSSSHLHLALAGGDVVVSLSALGLLYSLIGTLTETELLIQLLDCLIFEEGNGAGSSYADESQTEFESSETSLGD